MRMGRLTLSDVWAFMRQFEMTRKAIRAINAMRVYADRADFFRKANVVADD